MIINSTILRRGSGYLSRRSAYSVCGHYCLEFVAAKKLVGSGERCARLDQRRSGDVLAQRIIFDHFQIGWWAVVG